MNENEKRILKTLYDNKGAMRQDLRNELEMRVCSIVETCDGLLSKKLIKKEDESKKRHVKLQLVKEKFCAVGIEHTASKLSLIMINADGEELLKDIQVLSPVLGGQQRLHTIVRHLADFINKLPDRYCVRVLGFSADGFLDHQNAVCLYAANIPDWQNIKIKEVLENEFSLPVKVTGCHDATWIAGNLDFENALYTVVEDGIGTSIVANGRFLTEQFPSAGELGHTYVEGNERMCSCGKKGCLETLATAKAIKTDVAELKHIKESDFSIEDVNEWARHGDEVCKKALSDAGRYLGAAVANMVSLIGIENVILRAAHFDKTSIFCKSFEKNVRKNLIASLYDNLYIDADCISTYNGAKGAALLALKGYFG